MTTAGPPSLASQPEKAARIPAGKSSKAPPPRKQLTTDKELLAELEQLIGDKLKDPTR